MTETEHEAIPLLKHALAPFDQWWDDPDVEDILINRPNEAFVRRGALRTRYDIPCDFVDLEGIAILAASLKSQNVGRVNPILSCDLPGGIRLQAVLPPCVNSKTVALAIRRPRGYAPTLDELSEGGIFLDMGAPDIDRPLIDLYRTAKATQEPTGYIGFLREAIRARKTVVLGGLVGSGKTTFAMGLIREIPLEHRLAIIQDADEWAALPHQNKVEMFYSKGMQGESSVTATTCIEASLRLAMDWLLLQEVRGAEAYSFLRGRKSGHPGISTMHADSVATMIPALALMAKQDPAVAATDVSVLESDFRSVIDICVHLHRPDGRFRVSDVWFRAGEDAAA